MACIYEDTASHGIKGGKQCKVTRLVAEISVKGKRRRRRGYNYQELRAWLDDQIKEAGELRGHVLNNNGSVRKCGKTLAKCTIKRYLKTGEFRIIKGFSKYAMHMRKRYFCNIVKGNIISTQNKGRSKIVALVGDDGTREYFNLERLIYAVEKDINPSIIPAGFAFRENGEVITRGEMMSEKRGQQNAKNRQMIVDIKAREAILMSEYYHTLDIAPVEYYLLRQRTRITLLYAKRRHHMYGVDLDDLFDEAMYRTLKKIENPQSMISGLTFGIMNTMQEIAVEKYRMKRADDMNYGEGL